MSLRKGNDYLRKGEYLLALGEYQKVLQNDPLYDQAQFNIQYINKFAQKNSSVVDGKQPKVLEKAAASTALIAENTQIAKHEGGPLLSIVMPVYNVAPYLDACLISVRAQSFQDFELIVVDDASSDNAKKIIEMHAALDPRIKFISLPYNTLGGAGIPSNIGMKAATGKYIGFVDSDDWVDVHAFRSLVLRAEQHDADLVIGDFCTFDENERTVSPAYDKEFWETVPLDTVVTVKEHPELLKFSPVPWRKLYKSSFVRSLNIQYPEGDFFFEDNPLHWAVVTKASSVVVTDQLVSFHRMAREGQTMSSGAFRFSALLDHMNNIRTGMPKTDTNMAFLRAFIHKSRWIVARQKDPQIADLFRKRLAQEYSKCKGGAVVKAEATQMSKFDAAFPTTALTVVVYAENENDALKATLSSIKFNDVSVNTLVLLKEVEDERLSVLNAQGAETLYFNFNRIMGRAVNSLQPLCSGEYVLFLDAGETVNTSVIEQSIQEAKQAKSDVVVLRTDELQTNPNVLINRGFMHFCNIFFGPTVYSNITYFWLSILYAKRIHFTTQKFVNTKNEQVDYSDLDALFNELDNLLGRLKVSEMNKKHLPLFMQAIGKLSSQLEAQLDTENWKNFKAKENVFIEGLNKLGGVK